MPHTKEHSLAVPRGSLATASVPGRVEAACLRDAAPVIAAISRPPTSFPPAAPLPACDGPYLAPQAVWTAVFAVRACMQRICHRRPRVDVVLSAVHRSGAVAAAGVAGDGGGPELVPQPKTVLLPPLALWPCDVLYSAIDAAIAVLGGAFVDAFPLPWGCTADAAAFGVPEYTVPGNGALGVPRGCAALALAVAVITPGRRMPGVLRAPSKSLVRARIDTLKRTTDLVVYPWDALLSAYRPLVACRQYALWTLHPTASRQRRVAVGVHVPSIVRIETKARDGGTRSAYRAAPTHEHVVSALRAKEVVHVMPVPGLPLRPFLDIEFYVTDAVQRPGSAVPQRDITFPGRVCAFDAVFRTCAATAAERELRVLYDFGAECEGSDPDDSGGGACDVRVLCASNVVGVQRAKISLHIVAAGFAHGLQPVSEWAERVQIALVDDYGDCIEDALRAAGLAVAADAIETCVDTDVYRTGMMRAPLSKHVRHANRRLVPTTTTLGCTNTPECKTTPLATWIHRFRAEPSSARAPKRRVCVSILGVMLRVDQLFVSTFADMQSHAAGLDPAAVLMEYGVTPVLAAGQRVDARCALAAASGAGSGAYRPGARKGTVSVGRTYLTTNVDLGAVSPIVAHDAVMAWGRHGLTHSGVSSLLSVVPYQPDAGQWAICEACHTAGLHDAFVEWRVSKGYSVKDRGMTRAEFSMYARREVEQRTPTHIVSQTQAAAFFAALAAHVRSATVARSSAFMEPPPTRRPWQHARMQRLAGPRAPTHRALAATPAGHA